MKYGYNEIAEKYGDFIKALSKDPELWHEAVIVAELILKENTDIYLKNEETLKNGYMDDQNDYTFETNLSNNVPGRVAIDKDYSFHPGCISGPGRIYGTFSKKEAYLTLLKGGGCSK